jgi:hypothetical protein
MLVGRDLRLCAGRVFFENSSGSLAILLAILRASSLLSNWLQKGATSELSLSHL